MFSLIPFSVIIYVNDSCWLLCNFLSSRLLLPVMCLVAFEYNMVVPLSVLFDWLADGRTDEKKCSIALNDFFSFRKTLTVVFGLQKCFWSFFWHDMFVGIACLCCSNGAFCG